MAYLSTKMAQLQLGLDEPWLDQFVAHFNQFDNQRGPFEHQLGPLEPSFCFLNLEIAHLYPNQAFQSPNMYILAATRPV